MPEVKAEVCLLLRRLERLLAEAPAEVPAAGMALFHVRRAMELSMCNPEKPSIEEEKLFERGVIVE